MEYETNKINPDLVVYYYVYLLQFIRHQMNFLSEWASSKHGRRTCTGENFSSPAVRIFIKFDHYFFLSPMLMEIVFCGTVINQWFLDNNTDVFYIHFIEEVSKNLGYPPPILLEEFP